MIATTRSRMSLATRQASRIFSASFGFFGNFEPDCEIERSMMSVENRRQAFGLWYGARKPIENKTVRAVQPEPVFNQFHNRCIRDQSALLNYLGRLRPQRCPEIFLSSQNCARRR